MTTRLFIALDIPKNIIEDLVIQRDNIYGVPNDLRWENNDKLHITLKFLGDVGENILDLMIKRFDEIKFPKIITSFNKFSFFKKNGMLKILFADIKQNFAIDELQKIILHNCKLLGFESVNKKFHPHLTLLRLKGNENFDRLRKFHNSKIESNDFEINSFSIIKSELNQNGSKYKIIKSFKLI